MKMTRGQDEIVILKLSNAENVRASLASDPARSSGIQLWANSFGTCLARETLKQNGLYSGGKVR